MKFLVVVLLAAALVFCLKCETIHKDLVSDRQGIDADWAQVDAALAQRAEVVPELTNLVQAEAPAESGLIHAVNDARNALTAAKGQHQRIQANARLDEAMARLMLQVENYPKLESGKRYGDVLEALKGAEYQIAVARRKYNEAVEHYNARIDVFPSNIVASVTHSGKIDAYFQTPAM
jgi:LemA protein